MVELKKFIKPQSSDFYSSPPKNGCAEGKTDEPTADMPPTAVVNQTANGLV
jgi:hypothetical protein